MRHIFKRLLPGIMLAFAACAGPKPQIIPNPWTSTVFKDRPNKLLVFFDGTANEWRARTNVRRTFELAAAYEDPTQRCFWVEGVGTETVLGKAFGIGMKPRIMGAYDFLARNYRPGDKIYIFGFSRGAFQARALCGILAHCGLYEMKTDIRDRNGRYGNGGLGGEKIPIDEIWTISRKLKEEPNVQSEIVQQLAANRKIVVDTINQNGRYRDVRFRDVEVNFLGLWDTVPGLPFTHFDEEGRQTSRGKVDEPHYKVKPYPNIRVIAHALSIDEKRSKFSPLRVGPALVPAKTSVHEVWFPGAHSDIGGGYSDSNEVAGLSMSWMAELLRDDNVLPGSDLAGRDKDAPLGVIHHSEWNFWGSFGSHELVRHLPANAFIHQSFVDRLTLPAGPGGGPWETVREGGTFKKELYRPQIALHPSSVVADNQLPESFLNDDQFDARAFAKHFRVVGWGEARKNKESSTARALNYTEAQVQTSPEPPKAN